LPFLKSVKKCKVELSLDGELERIRA